MAAEQSSRVLSRSAPGAQATGEDEQGRGRPVRRGAHRAGDVARPRQGNPEAAASARGAAVV